MRQRPDSPFTKPRSPQSPAECDTDVFTDPKVEIPQLAVSVYAVDTYKPPWDDARYSLTRVIQLVRDFLHNSPQEQMVPVLLNERRAIIGYFCASKGPHNSLLLESEDIFLKATWARAREVVLVHNHPIGPLPLQPSTFDRDLTAALVEDGRQRWHIPVYDHLILSNVVRDVFSFRQAKQLVMALTAVILLWTGDASGLWGQLWDSCIPTWAYESPQGGCNGSEGNRA